MLTPSAGKWDAIETYAPSVVMNGSTYEMFYSGNTGGAWLTGHASSTDGTVWIKDNNAILSPSGGTAWDKGDSTDYVAAVIDGSTWKLFYSGAGGGYQIGLLTLTNKAQLTFRQLASSVGVAGNVTVYIDLNAVTDLYGYQFKVNYNNSGSVVSAVGSFEDSFFNTVGQFIPGGWNADCAAGVCKFAVTKQAATAVSGSGVLAKIVFTGVAAGRTTLTFSEDILSTKDADVIPNTATVGWLDVNGTATITGIVNLQGRSTPKDAAGTVTLYDMYGYLPPTVVNYGAANGNFTAVVPVAGGGTTYDLLAAHLLYLTNKKTGVAVTAGGSANAGTTKLLGGDATNSGKIDIGDLTCIGGGFGSSGGGIPNCGGMGSADINADNVVNILDLVLAGGNYGLASAQPW